MYFLQLADQECSLQHLSGIIWKLLALLSTCGQREALLQVNQQRRRKLWYLAVATAVQARQKDPSQPCSCSSLRSGLAVACICKAAAQVL